MKLLKTMKYGLYILFVLGLFVGVLSYTGFCYKRMGYVTKEEKIRIAIDYMLSQRKKIADEASRSSANTERDEES